jgi:large subunit ribosomal protein L2
MPFFLKKFEYDPNRNTLVSLFCYYNGLIAYMISVEGLVLGNIYMNGIFVKRKIGNSFPVKYINSGTKINNLEINLFGGSVFLRAGGSFGKILKKSNKFCLIRLKSGKVKRINYYCMATIGVTMNFNYYLNRYRNAGLNRLKGFRPHVRGVAMNPVDHPYGGGEGKKSKKSIAMSPWGKLMSGKKTRK